MWRNISMPWIAGAAVLAVAVVLSWPRAAAAQSLHLQNLVVDNQAGSFMARFGVSVDGLDEVAQSVENGVTVALDCTARLFRKRSAWADAMVSEGRYQSRLQFDSLTGEYVLTAPGRETPYRDTDLKRILAQAWSALNVDLGPWSNLSRGDEYRIDLSITLSQTDVPAWLKNTLFFWSWDVAPATSYQLEFRY